MSVKKRRTALLLVSDKTGIVEFAIRLSELGYDLVSAGSTAKTLKQAIRDNVDPSARIITDESTS